MRNSPVAELFADGIGDISFGAGVVRIDLYSFSATDKDAAGNPGRELRQRVIMSPQGFVESFAAMQAMIGRLRQAGIVRAESDGAGAPEEPARAEAPVLRRSPNFQS